MKEPKGQKRPLAALTAIRPPNAATAAGTPPPHTAKVPLPVQGKGKGAAAKGAEHAGDGGEGINDRILAPSGSPKASAKGSSKVKDVEA